MDLPANERTCLRELARRVAEIAADPVQKEKTELWLRHNDLEHVRPMVLVFPEGSWREIAADWKMTCTSEWARGLEWNLRSRLYCWEHLRDDNVIEATIQCPIVTRSTGLGPEIRRTRPEEATGACHFDPVIVEESDIEKIRIPQLTVDWAATEENAQQLNDVFDGLLTVVKTSSWGSYGWAPMDMFIQWRGIDRMYEDLMDRPEWVHQVMRRLLAARMAEIDALEKAGALTLNNRNNYNGSGGVGYTRQLPAPGFDGRHVRTIDCWAMATAQIFSEVSPDMHEEFALQYERIFLERFGLSNYGCCEPLHNKLGYVKKIRNLRRVSISPWADIEKSARELGDQYVFSWKPNPAVIAAPRWKPDAVRAELRQFCEKTRGCITDIIMKDTHTCRNEPQRLTDWVRIALETAQEYAV